MTKIPSKLSSLVKARYQVRDNTFIRAAKDDPRDRIDVEIGDEKQPSTFYPQVKIKRWDNECNFSCRLKDDDYDTPTIQTSQDKIKWISGKREAHFYEIGASQDHPEGGYEFEVVLKEKPATNVVEFSIETKGVRYVYNPDFREVYHLDPQLVSATATETFDANGKVVDWQRENNVGSYAIYTSERRINYEGGKLYRSGKIGHIYRPKIRDASGEEVWGKLGIDEVKKLLTVEIPQDFLDRAVYPVIVDPTFGTTTLGGATRSCAGRILALHYQISEAGTATQISGGFYHSGSQSNIKMAIYAYTSSSDAGSKVAESATGVTPGGEPGSFVNCSISASLSASTYYFLAGWGDGSAGMLRDGFSAAGIEKSVTYGTWPDPLTGESGSYVNNLSIYCTYTASASGPANLKTFDGLAKASVKTINGLAIASVKSVDGLT